MGLSLVAVPILRLFRLPCLWKASLRRGANFLVRPLKRGREERAERSTATHGASKKPSPFAIDGAGADGSAEGSSSWRFAFSYLLYV